MFFAKANVWVINATTNTTDYPKAAAMFVSLTDLVAKETVTSNVWTINATTNTTDYPKAAAIFVSVTDLVAKETVTSNVWTINATTNTTDYPKAAAMFVSLTDLVAKETVNAQLHVNRRTIGTSIKTPLHRCNSRHVCVNTKECYILLPPSLLSRFANDIGCTKPSKIHNTFKFPVANN